MPNWAVLFYIYLISCNAIASHCKRAQHKTGIAGCESHWKDSCDKLMLIHEFKRPIYGSFRYFGNIETSYTSCKCIIKFSFVFFFLFYFTNATNSVHSFGDVSPFANRQQTWHTHMMFCYLKKKPSFRALKIAQNGCFDSLRFGYKLFAHPFCKTMFHVVLLLKYHPDFIFAHTDSFCCFVHRPNA